MVNLKGRDLLKMSDLTTEEVFYLLDLAAELKDKKKNGIPVSDRQAGKNIALIFEKTSTRTRCSFEVAAHDLGMNVTYLDPASSQIGWKESIADTARVLAGMFEGIEYRGFEQTIVEELAYYSKVPVWNGLTNESHPTQMLADLLTIREHFGRLEGLTLCYMGDARMNTANSLMVACALVSMNCVICAPKKYQPAEAIVEKAKEIATGTGSEIIITESPQVGAMGADIIYTDVWVSLGEPEDVWKERITDLSPYRVDKSVMDIAGCDAVFMHCLPSFHDLGTKTGREISEKYGLNEMEVTDEVFEAPYSLVFVEAENRMHTIKAVMDATL